MSRFFLVYIRELQIIFSSFIKQTRSISSSKQKHMLFFSNLFYFVPIFEIHTYMYASFVRYMGAELEARRHWTLFSESGLCVPIDLWDPHKYKQKSESKTSVLLV